jgi:hypothetical protein
VVHRQAEPAVVAAVVAHQVEDLHHRADDSNAY